MEDCPQQKDIESVNRLTGAHLSFLRMLKINPSTEDELQAVESASIAVEDSVEFARLMGCRKCGGMVVDMSTGILYCGLEVPQPVLESNARIQSN